MFKFTPTCLSLALCAAFLATAVLPVDAQSRRPLSTSMTCSQVKSLIKQQGAVVLSTGQYTFDRYVANGSYCARGEATYNERVPTKDTKKCVVQRCGSETLFRDTGR